MRVLKLTLALVVLAFALGGCASSGGGSDGAPSSRGETAARQTEACTCIGFQCLLTGCNGELIAQSQFPTPPSPSKEPFREWSEVQGGQLTEAPALSIGYSWVWSATDDGISFGQLRDGSMSFAYDGERRLEQFAGFVVAEQPQALAPLGFPGLEKVRSERHTWLLDVDATGVFANPYTLGWEYQSFGAWNSFHFPAGDVTAASFGTRTPAPSVPVSGQASFAGQLGGRYVSPEGAAYTAAANTSVSVNFQTRELGFASSGTVLTRDFATAVQAPNLDLHGTLTYAPGANAFSGTLASQSGTLSGTTDGRFYGPAAQELGGVFLLKSETTPEQLVGAYGAKR